jgi:hypothetical protein
MGLSRNELRDDIESRLGALKLERTTWDAHHQEAAQFILPRLGRWHQHSDSNRGAKKNTSIINETGTLALGALVAGMMVGLTSPGQPWHIYETEDKDLLNFAPVRRWLDIANDRSRKVFAASNFYTIMPGVYEEIGVFGTEAMLGLEDFNNVVRFMPFSCGEYFLATDESGDVDTLYREYSLTVKQLAERYGLDNASPEVRSAYANGTYDRKVPLLHAVEPRLERDITRADNRNMPWRSVVIEYGAGRELVLNESGFDRNPIFAPRWHISTSEQVYARSPGMEALGGIKQLQHQEKRKAEAIDKLVRPPLKAPGGLRDLPMNLLPGGVTYYDGVQGRTQLEPVYSVAPRLDEMRQDIAAVEERVDRAFHRHLFEYLSRANASRDPQKTATEILAIEEEQKTQIGPIIYRFRRDLLDRAVNFVFQRMVEADMLPPPPPELEGQELDIVYTSPLVLAQEASAIGSMERFASTVANMAPIFPDIVDKLDAAQFADELAQRTRVPASIVRSDEEVAERQARQQAAMQAQQATEMAATAAAAAKDASQASTGEGNVLGDAMAQMRDQVA